jgi:class 3 adenylate cyclase
MLLSVEVPDTRYAKSGDLHIAYQVAGSGPPDIVFPTTLWSPLDLLWEDPLAARGLRRLASMGRLIGCDLRGWGSSDAVDLESLPALQAWMDDLGVVMDEAGSEQAALIGAGEVGLVAILFAATYPERVSALVLINSFARFRRGPDQPWGMPLDAAERYLRVYLETTGRGPVAGLLAPSRAGEPGFRRWFAKCERLSRGPRANFTISGLFQASDVTVALPSIRAPTLVLHTTGDPHVRSGHAELLTERIPHAQLVELPGADHVWYAGDVEGLFDQIEAFLTGARAQSRGTRVLTTVLFTDVVGSTERAAQLGDRAWTALLHTHDELVRGQVEAFRGKLVKTSGDGTLAMFDGPARAIHCAAGIRDAVKTIDLSVRAGLHTGEVELRGADVAGLAVHIGARIAGLADADEILVSASVPPLVAGSGIRFREHGRYALKGIPKAWDVLGVESGA